MTRVGRNRSVWVIQMAGRRGLKTEGCGGEGWGEGLRSSLRAGSLSQAASLLSPPCRSLSPRIPDQPSSGLDQVGGWDSLIPGHVQPYWNLKQACVCVSLHKWLRVYMYVYIYICIHRCVCVLSRFSPVLLFAALWTVALQAPPSVGVSRQEY